MRELKHPVLEAAAKLLISKDTNEMLMMLQLKLKISTDAKPASIIRPTKNIINSYRPNQLIRDGTAIMNPATVNIALPQFISRHLSIRKKLIKRTVEEHLFSTYRPSSTCNHRHVRMNKTHIEPHTTHSHGQYINPIQNSRL